MTPFVILFFIHATLATLLLGFQFGSKQESVFKYFGFGLLLDSVAFVIWSIAVIFQPADLSSSITLGMVFFIASLVSFFAAGTQQFAPKKKKRLLFAVTVVALALFLARSFIYISEAGFSPEGLFFFNLQPVIQVLYVFFLAFTVFPAIDAVTARLKDPIFSGLVRYGFGIVAVGGIILMTCTDATVVILTGSLMSFALFALWMMSYGRAKAWQEVE